MDYEMAMEGRLISTKIRTLITAMQHCDSLKTLLEQAAICRAMLEEMQVYLQKIRRMAQEGRIEMELYDRFSADYLDMKIAYRTLKFGTMQRFLRLAHYGSELQEQRLAVAQPEYPDWIISVTLMLMIAFYYYASQ